MSLVLTITNVDQLDNGEPTQLKLDRHGAVIGRSPHSDWSLPDTNNYVSSTHCEVDYRNGGYTLLDKSTNGTFVNGAEQRMAGPYALKDGDVISIGHYRVKVSGAGTGAADAPPASAAASPQAAAPASGGWGGWDAKDAAAPAAPASAGWESAPSGWADKPAAPVAGSGWGEAAVAPAASEPAGWATADPQGGASGWGSSTPEASSGWAAADTGGASAWGAPSPSATPAPPPSSVGWSAPAPAAAPSAGWGAAAVASNGGGQAAAWGGASAAPDSSVWGAAGAGPAQPKASGWDSIGPARDMASAAATGAYQDGASPVSGRGALSQSWAPPRVDTPSAPPPPAAADPWSAMAASNAVDWGRGGFGDPGPSAAAPAPLASAGPDAVWAAFLQGSGVAPDGLKAEPAQAAATAGALLKRMIAGLVVMMEARARAKAQLGAQSTTLELNGNNPLKFARSPERVLAQMLNAPERGFMGATDAVEDSFRDLQAHQMATLAAMQGALRATLDRFSPTAIRSRAEMRGVLARILPGARNATLWEAYEREFEGVAKSSDEAFMDVFAKAFKQAYEQAAAQMKSQGR